MSKHWDRSPGLPQALRVAAAIASHCSLLRRPPHGPSIQDHSAVVAWARAAEFRRVQFRETRKRFVSPAGLPFLVMALEMRRGLPPQSRR